MYSDNGVRNKSNILFEKSASVEWGTPKALFDVLNNEFNFSLDAAASDRSHKCENYYTKEDDALTQTWYGNVFINPPYGRVIRDWLTKALNSLEHINSAVFLLPAYTESKWFQDIIIPNSTEVRFIRGRLTFELFEEGKEWSNGKGYIAPFPSAVVIFNKSRQDNCFMTSMKQPGRNARLNILDALADNDDDES